MNSANVAACRRNAVSDNASRFGYPVVEMPEWASSSPEAAVKFLVEQMVQLGQLPADKADDVVRSVVKREAMGTTAIGRGVAMPHSKSDTVSDVRGVVGRAAVAVKWPGAMDEEPVKVVCLMITPLANPRATLQALEAAVRAFRGD
jgi:PTS system fructose-specific IIA component/PTS system nitrogen regulatory IIA component